MRCWRIAQTSVSGTAVSVWMVAVMLPLTLGLGVVLLDSHQPPEDMAWGAVWYRSFAQAVGIAAGAVFLGWIPGLWLGRVQRGREFWLLGLLGPLILPRYVLYYAWSQLLNPTGPWGPWLAQHPALARGIGQFLAGLVLVLWTWPLAALVIGQAYHRLDRRLWELAALEARPFRIRFRIVGPLMGQALGLSFLLCFSLTLSDFATFHLSGQRTLGTELAVLYELTGSAGAVLRQSAPVLVLAFMVAGLLAGRVTQWARPGAAQPNHPVLQSHRGLWFCVSLWSLSLVVPLLLLLINLREIETLWTFFRLHGEALTTSGLMAVGAAGLAALIAYAPQVLSRWVGGGLGWIARASIFTVMLMPGSLLAVFLLQGLSGLGCPASWRGSGGVLFLGLGARFSGVALLLLELVRIPRRAQLLELAAVDGACPARVWWAVTWPQAWRTLLSAGLLVALLSLTELATTMVLLPAGVPSFAQRLLNQMHYARDQQTLAACLVLWMTVAAVCLVTLGCLRPLRLKRSQGFALILLCLVLVGGCKKETNMVSPEVVGSFGRTGRGPGEFMYPRAIAQTSTEELLVVDKAGRIQRFDKTGVWQYGFEMPDSKAGKPTGMAMGPDGLLYVADTHYHRILVTTLTGETVRTWGHYGETNGAFIYPTDVAFSPDGRLFVSEYGGNDRISVFDSQGQFLYDFGSAQDVNLSLSRPAALQVDAARRLLYIADACHHRIVVVDYDGQVQRIIGDLGQAPGQLRFPYDLALLAEGRLVVCEYGNNRVQIFDRSGQSLAIWGQAGRTLGSLAYPWGVVVDQQERAYIVDAGNNRIQIWQL